jgi:phenylalanyl-tRNA synthetase beta subunit
MDVLNYFNIMVGNTSYIVDNSNIKLENNKLNNVDVLTDLPEIKDGYLVTIASSFKTNPMSVKNLDHNFGLKNARGTTNRFMEETLNLIVEYGQKFGYIKSATTPVVVKESDTHTIEFTNEKLFNFIGHEINLDEAFTKLEKLGFKFEEGKVTVPSYRKDVEGIQDLVEEILRFYGIDNVEPKEDTETESVENEFHKAQTERLNDYLVNHGLYEVKTYELLTEKESKSYDL